jgi:putative flippase GtrA
MAMDFISAPMRARLVASATAARYQPLLSRVTQLSRYSAASALALALDFATYLSLAGGGMKPVLAGVLGYSAGLVLHFVLSSRFVFNATASDKTRARLMGEFALSGLAGIGATAIVMAIATDLAGLPGLVAKMLAAGASFVLVYWLRCTIVFAAPTERAPNIG